jgi:hypothetical protein
MLIDSCLEHGAFGPEATEAMGEAFEAVCRELHGTGNAEGVRNLIAEQIIGAASRGELDPVRLRTAALSWILGRRDVARSLAPSK